MTVQELIQELNKLDGSKEILVKDKFQGVYGSFNIEQINGLEYFIEFDGEWKYLVDCEEETD